MTLERRLREQFDATGDRLPEPADRLERVVQRGRRRRLVQNTTLGLTAVAVVLGAGAGWRAVNTTHVAFEPGATPSATVASDAATPTAAPTPTPAATIAPTADPSPASTERPDPTERVAISDLGTEVLTYESGAKGLSLHTSDGEQVLWSGRVNVALPDNKGGAVLQSDNTIVWVAAGDDPITVVALDRPLELRAVLQDRVLYSVPDTKRAENMVERYFIVELASGAEPELFETEGSFESWSIGPAALADGSFVMAGCHMMCSISAWSDNDTTVPFQEPLYNGGGGKQGAGAAIEGLTATPDGAFLGWVDYLPMPGLEPPELVLFDGVSVKPLARIVLPVNVNRQLGRLTVSLSADGQRVLVTVLPPQMGPGQTTNVRHLTFLVDRALTAPRVRIVDAPGIVRWSAP